MCGRREESGEKGSDEEVLRQERKKGNAGSRSRLEESQREEEVAEVITQAQPVLASTYSVRGRVPELYV